MAVISVGPLLEAGGSWNKLWQRTYVGTRKVECDAYDDGPVVIRFALDSLGNPALPRIGHSYFVKTAERDVGSFLENVSYKRTHAGVNPNSASWELTEEYGPYDASIFSENPIEWPLKLVTAGQNYEKVIIVDRNGNAILNSADDPYKDPFTVDGLRRTIVAVRNEAIVTFNFDINDVYANCVNDAPWNGYPTNSVKCGIITTSDPQYDSNSQTWYYQVTYSFEIDKENLWKKKPLDQGFAYKDPATSAKVAIVDESGNQVQEPELLDGSGGKLAFGGTPVFGDWDVQLEANFDDLAMNFAAALGRV